MLLFLLMQVTIASSTENQNLGISNPWTDYVKLMPSYVPLPTTWSEEEGMMLKGTTLEVNCIQTGFHVQAKY